VSGGVFICYRREDSAGFARLIYDRLRQKLGPENVFFDVDNIPLGVDFRKELSRSLDRCGTLVAVIGKNWLSAERDNLRRLDDPQDYVRMELEAALGREIRIIPVLLDGARMPEAEDLPESLKELSRRQAVEISHNGFEADVQTLIRGVSRRKIMPNWPFLLGVFVALAAIAAVWATAHVGIHLERAAVILNRMGIPESVGF
jgi:hypothetical protein